MDTPYKSSLPTLHSSEADSRLLSQEIPRLSQNLKIHNGVHEGHILSRWIHTELSWPLSGFLNHVVFSITIVLEEHLPSIFLRNVGIQPKTACFNNPEGRHLNPHHRGNLKAWTENLPPRKKVRKCTHTKTILTSKLGDSVSWAPVWLDDVISGAPLLYEGACLTAGFPHPVPSKPQVGLHIRCQLQCDFNLDVMWK